MENEGKILHQLERQRVQREQMKSATTEDIYLWFRNHLTWMEGFGECLANTAGNALKGRAADMRKLLKELQRRNEPTDSGVTE
jgi:hypothetical protein